MGLKRKKGGGETEDEKERDRLLDNDLANIEKMKKDLKLQEAKADQYIKDGLSARAERRANKKVGKKPEIEEEVKQEIEDEDEDKKDNFISKEYKQEIEDKQKELKKDLKENLLTPIAGLGLAGTGLGILKGKAKTAVGKLKGKAKTAVGKLKGKAGTVVANLKENAGTAANTAKNFGEAKLDQLKTKIDDIGEEGKNYFEGKIREGKEKFEKGKEKFEKGKKYFKGKIEEGIESSNRIINGIQSGLDDKNKENIAKENLMDNIFASVAAATTGVLSGDNEEITVSSKNTKKFINDDIFSLAAATASVAAIGNANNSTKVNSAIVTDALNETISSNNLWGNIKYNKYPLLILIVLVINSYFIIANIIRYSNNNNLLTLKLNLYDNKYNNFEFYNLPVILSLYVISFILLIFYYKYNEKKGGVFDLDYHSNCVISMIYFAFIIANIVIISMYAYNWMYDEIYNKINESLKAIDDKIYSEISPKFLYFMHKLETFGDNINSLKNLINEYIKEFNDLKKTTDNIEEIIIERLRILITYKINKHFINSSNKDSFSNIESLTKEDKKSFFSYLKIDKYNILEPLEPDDIDIDEILKPFTSGANTIYNIEDTDGTIKDEIRKRYEEIQRSTKKNIIYIKRNSGNIYSSIFIYLSILSIFIYITLIISYIYILLYKIFSGKIISTKDIILYHYVYYGITIFIILVSLGLVNIYIL